MPRITVKTIPISIANIMYRTPLLRSSAPLGARASPGLGDTASRRGVRIAAQLKRQRPHFPRPGSGSTSTQNGARQDQTCVTRQGTETVTYKAVFPILSILLITAVLTDDGKAVILRPGAYYSL